MPSDDLILNLRQIAQYPTTAGVAATDAVLVQRGGIGGPYLSAAAQAVVSTALQGGGPFGVSLTPPFNSGPGEVYAGHYITALTGGSGYNAYWDLSGAVWRYLSAGPAAILTFGPNAGWEFSVADAGSTGAIATLETMFSVNALTGDAVLSTGTLTVARDPVAPLEVATANYVDGLIGAVNARFDGTVLSVNGRAGAVWLNVSDLAGMGGAPILSPVFQGMPLAPTPSLGNNTNQIATAGFVVATTVQYINNLLLTHPFVFSINGLSGDVILTAEDLDLTGLAPLDSPAFIGVPTAPTPPVSDNTQALATTQYVLRAISANTLLILNQVASTYAPLNSPSLTGFPQVPTAALGTSTGQIASTAFVMNAVTEATAGVSTFNTRTGAVTLISADIDGAGGALLASPLFTGTPRAPVAAPGDDTDQIATTAWVLSEIGGANIGVMSFNGRGGAVVLTTADITGAGGATLISPNFTGVPTAPTAAVGTATTEIATTAFVINEIAALNTGVQSFNGRTGVVTLNSGDVSAAGGATLASPIFTGSPTGPTPAPGNNSGQLATTAFVVAAIAASGAGVSTFNTRSGAVTLTSADVNAPAAGGPYVPVANDFGGFVNKFRNGTFDIWQRGTPINALTGGSTTTADGWYVAPTGGTVTVSRGILGIAAFMGGCSSLYIAGAAGVTACWLGQRIESFVSAQLPNNQPITVSFYVNPTMASTPQLQVSHPTALDNFTTNVIDLGPVNLQPCPAGVWTRVAYTFTLPVGAQQSGLSVWLLLGALGAGQQVTVTAADIRATPGVPVGLNANPPPSELRPISTELAFCQRYFVHPGVNLPCDGYMTSAGIGLVRPWSAPVVMRIVPSGAGIVASWSGLVNATAGGIAMSADSRTLQATFISVAAGAMTGTLSITSLSAEL